MKHVVLLSGGLDSTTLLHYVHAGSDGEVHALSFNYGQRHAFELELARHTAKALKVPHEVIDLPLGQLLPSALTTPERIKLKRNRSHGEITMGCTPSSYVPGRNLIFLAIAAGYAEAICARDIWIGVNVQDSPAYPDCSMSFLTAVEKTLNTPIHRGVAIYAPFSDYSKANIIREGLRLGVKYDLTSSCYDPQNDQPCKVCDACVLRASAFKEVGVEDPAGSWFPPEPTTNVEPKNG